MARSGLGLLWLLSAVACQKPPGTTADGLLADLQVGDVAYWPAWDAAVGAYAVAEGALPGEVTVTPVPASGDVSVSLRHETLDGQVLAEQDGTLTATFSAGERVVVEATRGDEAATYQLTVLPDDLPEISVQRSGAPSPGYFFLADARIGASGNYLLVLDNNGVPLWFDRQVGPAYDLRLQPSGRVSYIGQPNGRRTGVFLDESWAQADVFQPLATPAGVPDLDEHELRETEDGNVILLGEIAQAGDLSPSGGSATAPVVQFYAQEIDPSKARAFEWSTASSLDPNESPFLVFDAALGGWDHAHVNSVAVDPDDGNWLVSVRLRDEVLKVARRPTTVGDRTFAPGEVMWTLGGAASDFTFVDDARADGWTGFAGQHCAIPLGGGRLIVFDNALHREATGDSLDDQQIAVEVTGDSRFVEYTLDTDAMTATRVADHALAGSGATVAGGSVARLPDGHTVIGWGDQPMDDASRPTLTELDADGNVVLDLFVSGIWSYRAYKFER